ncbi:hypothetical protein J437_LFUL015970 [Ladona fulva]|uniref:Uncharacterized protein n=1 Tax=Ladona fulva TaxID=123851 RepID=A0A8K0KIQ8_LADFU|nr:hypothetical protein J437_LFUL015970 [Ladona fulva]
MDGYESILSKTTSLKVSEVKSKTQTEFEGQEDFLFPKEVGLAITLLWSSDLKDLCSTPEEYLKISSATDSLLQSSVITCCVSPCDKFGSISEDRIKHQIQSTFGTGECNAAHKDIRRSSCQLRRGKVRFVWIRAGLYVSLMGIRQSQLEYNAEDIENTNIKPNLEERNVMEGDTSAVYLLTTVSCTPKEIFSSNIWGLNEEREQILDLGYVIKGFRGVNRKRTGPLSTNCDSVLLFTPGGETHIATV